MTVTKPQAEAIANLAAAARPTGARQWDIAGVLAALAKVKHLDLGEVTMAAMRAAADATLHTPAAIGNTTTACWRERIIEPGRARPPKREEACLTCNYWLTACICGERRTKPHEPAANQDGLIAEARAAIRRARPAKTEESK